MKKDKITIFYVLLTLTILVAASIFIYNIDISKNNAQISEKAEKVYGSGKEYSKKVYSMFSAYTDEMGNYFDESNDTTNKISNIDSKKKAVGKRKLINIAIISNSPKTNKKEGNNSKYANSSIIIKTTKDKK